MQGFATDTIAPAGEERLFFRQVYGWMAIGLGITGAVSAVIGHSQTALHALFESNGGGIVIVLIILELALVWGLAGLAQHMNVVEAAATFIAYSALNGVTLSVIFAVYTDDSIYTTFFVTAAMFGALALWGYTTGADLTGWGPFLFMALIGQLIGLVVNLFWLNNTLYWVTTAAGVLIFSAFTAYDVQRLKRYEAPEGAPAAVAQKEAIVGALALYLDFVNLFLYMLRLLGRRR